MKRVLIIGGTSFLGRALITYLQGFSDLEVAASSRFAEAPAALSCDVTDKDQVLALFDKTRPELVFQLSGTCGHSDPLDHYRINLMGALHILNAASQICSQAGLVFTGSAAEYGPAGPEFLPVREDALEQPASFYGASKLAQTRAVELAAKTQGLKCLTVRPFNIIGPGLPDYYFLAWLAKQLEAFGPGVSSGQIQVHNTSSTRDFLDVRDAAKAYWELGKLALNQPAGHEIYNLCSGSETSILYAAQMLCRLYGNFEVFDAGSEDGRSGGISRSLGSPAKLGAATGWKPETPFLQSLRDFVEFRWTRN